jgi:hypothetical protein
MDSHENPKPADAATAPQFEQALQGGLAAMQKMFDGFAKMAHGIAGPEGMKNLQAGQWLSRVAASLDDAAKPGAALAGKAGEADFFLEHLGGELAVSKFAAQEPALRARLQAARQAIDAADSHTLTATAGYFRAAANTAIPLPAGADGVTVNFRTE